MLLGTRLQYRTYAVYPLFQHSATAIVTTEYTYCSLMRSRIGIFLEIQKLCLHYQFVKKWLWPSGLSRPQDELFVVHLCTIMSRHHCENVPWGYGIVFLRRIYLQ